MDNSTLGVLSFRVTNPDIIIYESVQYFHKGNEHIAFVKKNQHNNLKLI